MGILQGGLDVLMPHPLLDGVEINPTGHQPGAAGVPEDVDHEVLVLHHADLPPHELPRLVEVLVAMTPHHLGGGGTASHFHELIEVTNFAGLFKVLVVVQPFFHQFRDCILVLQESADLV